MSKFNSFTQFGIKKLEDVNFLIDDSPVEVIIMRRSSTGDNPGFESEVGEYADVGRIKARIDKSKTKTNTVETMGGEVIKEKYLGLTNDTSIIPRVNDIWKIGNVEYEVINIEGRYTETYLVELQKKYA